MDWNTTRTVHLPQNPDSPKKNRKYYFSRVADPHHFSADPDPAFYSNADPDPIHLFNLMRIWGDSTPHQSDGNLWPLVYRPSTTSFWASKAPEIFNLMPQRIQLFTLTRIRIQLPKNNEDPDTQPWFFNEWLDVPRVLLRARFWWSLSCRSMKEL